MKKFLSFVLAAALLLSLTACGGGTSSGSAADTVSSGGAAGGIGSGLSAASGTAETENSENSIILGDYNVFHGAFRYPGLGGRASTADLGIWYLTAGYAVMETDQNGVYRWNTTVVKDHALTENADGTATIRVEINHDLTYSDGTPITVKDYLVRLMAFSTQAAEEAGASGQAGKNFAGFDAYHAYVGDNGGEAVDGVTASKVFSGVRMIDDYTYELTVSSDLYPYYFAYTYASLQPDVPAMWLGEGVDIMDDGEGCYLSDTFYEKTGTSFNAAQTINASCYDTTKFPFSGPYQITEWDKDSFQVTMQINPAYKGNFEGQVPSIETVVYVHIVDEKEVLDGTRLEQLQRGGVDVLPAVTGSKINAALALVDGEHFAEGHYQRAGYGKLEFVCDFGPTMFPEVRQALAHLLDREAFCQEFLDGYGVVMDAPYSPDSAMWRAVQDDIDLTHYGYAPDTARKLLEDGGWIYNSKGEPYEEGAEGVDAVRYKKLTEEEASVLDGVNKTYAVAANLGGVTYQTVQVGGEYYLPLALSWLGTEQNPVSDLLAFMMAGSPDVAAAGMAIRATVCGENMLQGHIYRDEARGYEGVPTYNLFNLAVEWPDSMYDASFQWSRDPAYAEYSSNRLYDEYDAAFPYDPSGEKLTYEAAMEASGGKLGMDYLSMAMVYNAQTEEEYNQWWMAYIERWNELMPDIPMYSSLYYYVYNAKLENFEITPFFGQERAIIYANIKGH